MKGTVNVNRNNLLEIFHVFFKLGWIAFGGPAAHIAMMEKEVVEKRQWMSREHFLDLIGATNLIPGPNSTEMTMHCGYERAGWKGLFVAGMAFIFPAVFLTGILAWFYTRYGDIPAVEPFLFGIKPAVMAIIAGALYKLGQKALKSWVLGIIGIFTLLVALAGLDEIMAILLAGFLGLLWKGGSILKNRGTLSGLLPIGLLYGGSAATTAVSTSKLFFVFMKIGAVLFGSGYVLVAYLDGELVEKLGWLTQQELLDAIAIGQFTPGPVLSTATFVGYQIDGWTGALAATAGIFLPSFFFVLLLNPLVPRLRRSSLASGFLDAVNIGAVGIMVAVTFTLGLNILTDWRAWVIALASALVVFRFWRISSVWIVLGGAFLGYLLLLPG